ncbi:MAG: HAD-IB family phosphatase [candidate division KSB1 bacterium]|nr:HAD-IB family phosphatase [candidate division KSB1 bacterium]
MIWRSFQHIFFDCDSTLTRIEGIDELGAMLGKGQEIRFLTQQAMEGKVPLDAVFQKRLELLRPTRGQIERIGTLYAQNLVEDAAAVVAALQSYGREVYVVSGGFLVALQKLAACLRIPIRNVLGVDVAFDELQGDWYKYHRYQYRPNPEERYLALDGTSPMIRTNGKRVAIERLGKLPGGAMLIGDGASDLAAKSAVDLFVGYGGVVQRTVVAAEADVYVRCESLSPVFVLALGPRGWAMVSGTAYEDLYRKGLSLILDGYVQFRETARAILRSLQRSLTARESPTLPSSLR